MTSAAFLNSLTFVEQQFMPELGLKKKKILKAIVK